MSEWKLIPHKTNEGMRPYDGSLDSIDPVAYGTGHAAHFFHSDAKCIRSALEECDLTYWFHGKYGPDGHEQREFLNKWAIDAENAWYKEHKRLRKIDWEEKVKAFTEQDIIIGQKYFLEYDSNQGKYWPCEVVYISPNKEGVAFLWVDRDESDNGQLGCVGRQEGLATFHKERPDVVV